mmetsp:Transcript_26706/g.39499  ORF Transcript_26706/g.39499 Transcript_26706/m.39499 type:complete len:150 (+) Transcript_26706:991-1440(+)
MRLHGVIAQLPEPHFEVGKILQITHPDTVPTDFGSVRRTDSFLRRPDLMTAELILLTSVDFLMKIKDQMGSITQKHAAGVVNVVFGERVQLVQKGGEVHDDAVAHDAGRLVVQNSGGQQMEFVFLVADDYGMTRVTTTGDTSADVVFLT